MNAATVEEFDPPEVKGKGTKKYEQVSYFGELIEGVQFSPRQFYGLVLEQVRNREIPDLCEGQFTLLEGNILSRKRQYLQFVRERLVFEICAAPFGTGFFVSYRVIDTRRTMNWRILVAVISILACTGLPLLHEYGFWPALVAHLWFGAFLWSLMRYAVRNPDSSLDEQLWSVPVLGHVYEWWFHPDTYYRQDQAAMYRAAVEQSVKDALEEVRGNKATVRRVSPEELGEVLSNESTEK